MVAVGSPEKLMLWIYRCDNIDRLRITRFFRQNTFFLLLCLLLFLFMKILRFVIFYLVRIVIKCYNKYLPYLFSFFLIVQYVLRLYVLVKCNVRFIYFAIFINYDTNCISLVNEWIINGNGVLEFFILFY